MHLVYICDDITSCFVSKELSNDLCSTVSQALLSPAHGGLLLGTKVSETATTRQYGFMLKGLQQVEEVDKMVYSTHAQAHTHTQPG